MRIRSLLGLAFATQLLWSGVSLAAGMDEMSAGAFVGMGMPTYGKFADIVKARSEPGFAANMLVMGSHATFINRGFVAGGRVVTGSTKSQSATSGSHFGFNTLGFLMGYNLDMGSMSLGLGTEIGLGELTFATGNASSGGIVHVDFLDAAPQFTLGLTLLTNFKISIVGSYLYGLPYRVSQFGTQLLTKPTDATVGGIIGGIQLSFGFFR